MKDYWKETQKGRIIRIMIIKDQEWYEDFECEKYAPFIWKKIFVGNNAWPRLSELKKEWIVEVKYFDNPNALKQWLWKRAQYRLTSLAKEYYKTLYDLK